MPAADIDAYIAGFPLEVQQRLEQIRGLVLEIAPDAATSISYAMPAFKLDGRVLVCFAGFKHHIGFYPAPIETNRAGARVSDGYAACGSAGARGCHRVQLT